MAGRKAGGARSFPAEATGWQQAAADREPGARPGAAPARVGCPPQETAHARSPGAVCSQEQAGQSAGRAGRRSSLADEHPFAAPAVRGLGRVKGTC